MNEKTRNPIMSSEQDNGIWYVMLPDGERKEFKTNEAAWRWLDRHERREGWVSSRRQWRVPPTYALPSSIIISTA